MADNTDGRMGSIQDMDARDDMNEMDEDDIDQTGNMDFADAFVITGVTSDDRLALIDPSGTITVIDPSAAVAVLDPSGDDLIAIVPRADVQNNESGGTGGDGAVKTSSGKGSGSQAASQDDTLADNASKRSVLDMMDTDANNPD